jgi:hypothetical protein
MKSFFGQFYRNRFPRYSRIRNDDNSVGAKIFDIVGSEMHAPLKHALKSRKEKEVLLNNPITLPDFFYYVLLDSNSFYNDVKDNHFRNYMFSLGTNNLRNTIKIKTKTILAKKDNNVIACSVLSSFDLLFSLPPTRVSLSEEYIIDQNNALILSTTDKEKSLNYFFNYSGEYVYLTVHKDYKVNGVDKKIFYYSEDNPYSKYNGELSITLRGYDEFMNRVEEKIYIGLKSHYKSKTKFLYLKDLKQDNTIDSFGGFAFETNGFESLVELYRQPCYEQIEELYETGLLVNKDYFLNGSNDRFFADAFFDIKQNVFSYYFYVFSGAVIYKYNEFPKEYTRRVFYQQDLNIPVNHNIISYDIDLTRDLLVTLTDKGLLSFFPIERNQFKHPEINRTKYVSLEFENTIQRTRKLNEVVNLQLFDRHFTKRNDCILIFRRRPSYKNILGEANLKFEFLNLDNEWVETPYIFKRKQILNYNIPLDHLIENRLSSDITIPVLFDEAGQYDFYVMNYDISNSAAYEMESKYLKESVYTPQKLKKFFESELVKQEKAENENELFFELNYHSVYVESNSAYKTFQLLDSENEFLNSFQNKKISIKFKNVDNSLFFYVNNDTENSVNIYTVFLHFDYILFDQKSYQSTLVTFEDYDSISVAFDTINNNNSSQTFEYKKGL